MKKILFLLASLSVVAMLAGCDGKDTVPDSGAGTDEGQGTEDPEASWTGLRAQTENIIPAAYS